MSACYNENDKEKAADMTRWERQESCPECDGDGCNYCEGKRMTVKELIEQLRKLPESAHVMAYEGEDTGIAVTWEGGNAFIKTPPPDQGKG